MFYGHHLTETLAFFEEASARGSTSSRANYSARASVDPSFSITGPLATSAPEIDTTPANAPIALILAVLALAADRRHR
ncbi:MAG TPA: hypothetical protein VGO93_28555 [Candidatus Xenobia bacterium]